MVNRLDSTVDIGRLPSRTRLAAVVGTAIGALSRLSGRGTGSVIGGRAILAIDPRALGALTAGRQVALVSGTNGKTTTTRLLQAAVSTRGPVVTNALGANLPSGIAAALAAAPPAARLAALEVDEAWLGAVASATAPAVVVLLNLSRDQLDRNNEVRRLAARWRDALTASERPAPAHVVANADDPLVAWAALAAGAGSVTWVGAGQRWTADAAGCPDCGGRITWPPVLGGDWACSGCDLRRPALDVWLDGEDIVFRDGERVRATLALPGRVNRANAAMAVSAAEHFGVERTDAVRALATTDEVAGRYRTVTTAGGLAVRLLLAKNPAGWLETFDLLAPPPTPVVVAINAQIADGKDPSWLWDVPFERLQGRYVVATGERSADLAVRLNYADVSHEREPDPLAAIGAAARHARTERVELVANYTSFQAIRKRLADDQ